MKQIGAVRSAFAPWKDPAATPLVRFEGVTKRFGDTLAVDDVSLAIYEREFFALLGPSGCGKTTLMRMLAGFETPDAGRITLAGEDLAGIPPHRRPVNMMFQSYALFPHLSVERNIAFGLRMEGMDKAAIKTRVEEMLALVRLETFGKRMPHQLSGGQRQRVALARAIAKRPKLLLLDEPLAALDRKLREETQFELTDLQVELGMTFLIVTHDQDEAMVLADRIAVMDAGRITQIGPPAEVYEAPATRQVAEFLGDINIFEAKVEGVEPPMARLSAEGCAFWVQDEDCLPKGAQVLLSVRPEKMRIGLDKPPAQTPNVIAGKVWDIGYLGDWTTYVVQIGPATGSRDEAAALASQATRKGGGQLIRVARANSSRLVERPISWDDQVFVSFAPDAGVVLRP